MSVHYKFKSALDYDTVTFDGLHISVKDLKNSIIQQKRIGKSTDFDLQVTNAQTKEVYDDENALIPKNTSLLIARIPIVAQNKAKQWEGYGGDSTPPSKVDDGGPISRTADLSCLNAPEDEKIIAMMSQSTQDYDPSNYMKIRGANQMGPVPPNYRCYKCHQTGHWIKDCPLAQGSEPIEIKKSTGIPRSFMVPVEGPQVPGAMMTPNGSYAVPVLDHQAYNKIQTPAPVQEPKMEIPEDLVCSICSDLLSDAVMIPCCGNSFCDECIRSCLLESEEHECPDCHEKDISPGTLIPNRFLRNSVLNFKNTTGYVKKPVYRPKVDVKEGNADPSQKDVAPSQKADSTDTPKTDTEEKTVISEADSTENKPDDQAPDSKDNGLEPAKSTTSSESIPEGPPGVSPKSSPKGHQISNRVNYPREKSRHHKRERSDRSPKKHHRSRRVSPAYSDSGRNQEDRPGTPTVDEPGSGNYSYNAPPGTIPSIVGGMHAIQGPPPSLAGAYPPTTQPIGTFPTQGPPPNFRLPPPGTAPFISQPRGYPGPPRPLFDASRPPMTGPPPSYNPSYPGSRSHHGREYSRSRLRDRTPPGIIDDPLAVFNKMLREKDERERRNKARNNRRSYSRSRSRSRSYSRSPIRRMRSRTPRRRGSRSRSRSFSMSRSRSRSYSGGSMRGSPPYRHVSPPPRRSPPPSMAPPSRRGNSRFRSPMRSPTRRHDRNRDRDRDQDHDRDYPERSYREKERRDRDNRSRDRERDHRYYDGFEDQRRGGHGRNSQWSHGPPPRTGPPEAYYPPPDGYSNRYPPREYPPPNMPPTMPPVMQPMHMPPQRRFDDIAPPGVEEPPVPGLEASPTFDRFNQKPPEVKPERVSSPKEDKKVEKRSSDNRKDDRHSDRKRRHEKRSRTPERATKSPGRKRSKSKDHDSPDKHKKKRRDESHDEERDKRRDHSEDEKSKKSKEKKKKRDKKDSEKKKKKEKKEKHKKDDKEKKSKDEFKQVIVRKKEGGSPNNRDFDIAVEQKDAGEMSPKIDHHPDVERDEASTPEKIVTPKAELYDDVLVEDIDTSVMESYGKVPGSDATDIVDEEIIVAKEEPEEGEISNNYEEESEKDVLELHSTDIDLKTEIDKSEMLAPVPEKSKWEVEEDGSYQSSPKDFSKSDLKLDKSGKVTNEVLKRAENAIFAKAINAIRPIEIKKISLDRVKLYSGEREAAEKADNIKIQITLPVVPETKPPAPRLSVKERLGVKVDDNDRVVKLGRNRSRSLSPFSRRDDSSRNRGMNERRVEVNRNRRSRSRHGRESSRDRYRNRDNRRDHRDNRREDPRKIDRRVDSSRSKHREKSERRERSKSKGKALERRKRTRSRSPTPDDKKKKDKRHKKEKGKRHKDDAEDKDDVKSEKFDEPKLKPTTEKRKATIDESSFEPDYDLESESDKDEEKTETVKKIKDDKKEEEKPESSSSDSESSDSSEEERKKKKHKKHRKKKRKESSSSSSDSDSESSEDEKHKRKKHKKKQKKRKKSKHK